MNPQEHERVGPVPEWDLADRMKKSLRHTHISVSEMAAYLEVDRGSVSNWINGHNEPSAATLKLWALRTGVSYQWLKKGKGDEGDDGDPFQVAAEQPADPTNLCMSESGQVITGRFPQFNENATFESDAGAA